MVCACHNMTANIIITMNEAACSLKLLEMFPLRSSSLKLRTLFLSCGCSLTPEQVTHRKKRPDRNRRSWYRCD